MKYDALTKAELITILGDKDGKIAEYLQQLEAGALEIKTLSSNPEAQSQDVVALNNELTQNRQFIVELGDIIKKKDDTIKDLEANLDEAEFVIEDLKNQFNQATAQIENLIDTVTVTYKGKTYQAALPRFQHDGVVYEAKDLKSNPALVAELIEDELGVLKLVK